MTDPVATTNADPAELEKFSALAHLWWDMEGEFRPLHDMNPLRLDWINQTVGGLQGKRVLDVGCGGGILSESMARKGAQVTGIDLAEKVLKVAELHALQAQVKNVNYRHISAESMAEQNPESFDVVTCMEMLEHVPDPASIVRACAKMVKPGGWVFFSTINRSMQGFLYAIVAAEYILRMLPRGTHEYAKLIRPSELAAYARDAGLNLRTSRGMKYNPWNKRYSMNDDLSVNYLFATQKNGPLS